METDLVSVAEADLVTGTEEDSETVTVQMVMVAGVVIVAMVEVAMIVVLMGQIAAQTVEEVVGAEVHIDHQQIVGEVVGAEATLSGTS